MTQPLRRIVVGSSLAPQSDGVLASALAFARLIGAELEVVHATLLGSDGEVLGVPRLLRRRELAAHRVALGTRELGMLACAGEGAVELLELALGELAFVLADGDWRQEAEERLWRRGEEAAFLAGSPEGGETVTGVLEGLAPSGALLLRPAGADRPLEFASGELLFRAPRVDRSGSHHIR